MFKQFDMSTIKSNSAIVIIGQARTLINDIVAQMSLPSVTIPYNKNAVKLFFNGQRGKFKDRKRNGEYDLDKCFQHRIDNRIIAVVENYEYDENIKFMCLNSRHISTTLILTNAQVIPLPPRARCNIDVIFIFREDNMEKRKTMYDNYAGVFPTFELFCTFMDNLTNDFECMVIDCTTHRSELEDKVYWYKCVLN